MQKERIELGDTIMAAMIKMADGNPGAVNALMSIMGADDVDPDNFLGTMGPILSLDTYGIYGTDIYILYSDICDRDVVKMLAVLRSVQLGMFDRETLKDACHRQDRSGKSIIPVDILYAKVKKRLPNFNKE